MTIEHRTTFDKKQPFYYVAEKRSIMNPLSRAREVYREQGVIELIKAGTDYLRNRGGDTIRTSFYSLRIIDRWCYRHSVDRFESLVEKEESAEDAFKTARQYRGYGNYRSIEPMQSDEPLRELLERVKQTEPETVVEIGTARGGSFYAMVRILESADRFVSVNLGRSFGYKHKIPLLKKFDEEKNLKFIPGDSHSHQTYKNVKEEVGGKIDFLFIDGDHSYSGVKKDFKTYGDMVGEGGVIAFHDIQHEHPRVGVDELWTEIKSEYETEEIDVSPERTTGGIGVVYV